MIRIRLPEGETQRLELAFRQETDPQIPRPHPDRPPGQPRPAPPGDRTRPGHHPANRPALAQRLPRAGPRRPASSQGQGRARQDPRRPGRRGPPLGHRGACQAGARPRQLDPRRTGRPPVQDPWHRHVPLGHAALLPEDRHPRLPAHLPLPARQAGKAGGGQAGHRRAERESPGGGDRAAEPGRGTLPDGADAPGDVGRQGAPTQGGHLGLQGSAVRLCRGQPAQWCRSQQHAGEPQGRQEEDGQEQDPEAAGGVRPAPAARRPGLPARTSTRRSCC